MKRIAVTNYFFRYSLWVLEQINARTVQYETSVGKTRFWPRSFHFFMNRVFKTSFSSSSVIKTKYISLFFYIVFVHLQVLVKV